MNKRFVAGRRTRALAFGAWALPLGAAVPAAAAVAGCPGPEPHELAASGTGGSTASGGGTRATGSIGGATTTDTGLGGDVALDGGMGGGGESDGGCVNTLTDPANCGGCGHACSTANVLSGANVACSQGVCKPTCRPGFIDDVSPPAPVPDDGCETPTRRVFVTSAQVGAVFTAASGNLTPDQRCIAAVSGAGTNWKAWFSFNAQSEPAMTFETDFLGAYVLMDGKTVIARTWMGLTTQPLVHPIDMDEHQVTLMNTGQVWTATTQLGTALGANCLGWGSPDMSAGASVGSTAAIDFHWTQGQTSTCDVSRHLYCFEQH